MWRRADDIMKLLILFVMIIGCLTVLWIAILASWITGKKMGAQSHIYIRQKRVFQKLQNVKYIMAGKTGTITEGRLKVTVIRPLIHISQDKLLQIAASVGSVSNHPLGSVLEEEAKRKQIELLEARHTESYFSSDACGMEAQVEGQLVLLGSEQFIKDHGIIDKETMEMFREYIQDGKRPLILIREKEIIGFICIDDPIQESGKEAVRQLNEMGLEVILLTEDCQRIAKAIAEEAGIQEVYSGLSPEEKADKVKQYMEQKKYVVMVGGEENDIQALKAAKVGIVFKGEKNAVVSTTADVVLEKKDFIEVVKVFHLGKSVIWLSRKNVLWSMLCNLLSILIGIAGVCAFDVENWIILLIVIFQISGILAVIVNCIHFMRTTFGNKLLYLYNK